MNNSYGVPPVNKDLIGIMLGEEHATNSYLLNENPGVQKSYSGTLMLLGVIIDGERFEFCMCNPPFLVRMEEVGLNPKSVYSGTREEMVRPGGELAFITHIIEDSVVLKQSFWCHAFHLFFFLLMFL